MESTRNRLIELLETSNDQFVSGQSLSEKLNISRSAIWKHMKELEKDGYQIEGVSRKGYRIVNSPDKVSVNTIQWGLKTDWLGKKVIHKSSTTSTQQIAHQAANEGAEHGTVIIADEQTKGKGRMERQWYSTKNKGIWMSIILRPNLPPVMASQLTLLSATVLADAITEHTDLNPRIKWPNDILISHRKTAGILTELQAEQDQITYVVIGIGINVNHAAGDFQKDINNKATSLCLESGVRWKIRDLIQHILLTYEKRYDSFMKNGFPEVKHKWENYGYRIGEQIKIRTLHKEWEAKFLGIAEDGALLTETSEDGIKKLYSGEIEWFTKGGEQV
ncbi:biotin--[acetyl-CoA-carboxylase] ligase [Virgibacillus doumboii]|uniref:biotin--[acetyl-CoA-carboxylase] ligase n=1 Tax=Virgibacillus doumboii TaxID=2697503 RepID=UPI0013DEB363|nr:biotin--[acetyl-CoA-carboxylase] ligase [Virgibacillus doumboii]